ncbi:MAG: S41 family peptidase, partial [Planctomycetota bacterium]
GKRITKGPDNDQWPRFSPNGKQIAFFSNKKGNSDLFLHDLESGETRQLTRHTGNDFFHSWAPDGKSLVFASDRSGNKDIWLLDLETEAEIQLTSDRSADDDPSFSPDGKLIAFDSGREGSQAIYVMNRDGSGVRRVTQDTGFFQVPDFSPDGRMIVYEGFIPTTGRSGGLYVIETAGGPSVQISSDGKSACWDQTGEHIYFHRTRSRQGPGVYRMKAPEAVEVGEKVPFFGTVEVDLKQELEDLFDQAWSALRDGFYDQKMHGVDWNEMKEKYRDMAIDAENKAEFQNVIRQMLAELGASHLGIGGGNPNGSSVAPDVPQNGNLGLEFAHEPTPDGGREIVSVLAGGPADGAGLRVGDVVTKIGKTRLEKGSNLDRVTAGTVGEEIDVSFKPRSQAGLGAVRTLKLEPIALAALRRLQYVNWERQASRRVKEGTKGRVGYIHLTQMNGPNLRKFQQVVTQWNTPRNRRRIRGMVLDVRNNGGGNIHNQLMSVLIARPLARVQRRGGSKMIQPSLFWDRPVVLLTNERSFSDAEVFPHMFKAAGIGKVVGMPTAGGVIGTGNITLSDGSMFRVPGTGFWTMDGENLEGLGVKPDFLVRETPEDRAAGRDPQLAKAIEVVLADPRPCRRPRPSRGTTSTPSRTRASASGSATASGCPARRWRPSTG